MPSSGEVAQEPREKKRGPRGPPKRSRRFWSRALEEELDAELSLRAGLPEIVHPVARVVRALASGRRVDQGAVIVTIEQIGLAQIDRRIAARQSCALVQVVEDVR